MSKLQVLTYPSPSLKKKSKDVNEFNSRLIDLVNDMFETMYHERGIGLAAPQIGENINLFVMDVGRADPEDPENEDKYTSNKICMINPKIISHDGTIQYEEGCLSCPELLVKVDRMDNINVEFRDIEGRPQMIKLSELEAVCTQHEMDHLQGKLLTDRISSMRRESYLNERIRKRRDDQDRGDLD